jgi:hypothetical protein
MILDFTQQKYRELCTALRESRYHTRTVRDYLRMGRKEEEIAILRHDIDRKPRNALEIARLEHDMGIQSTYYFRYPSPRMMTPYGLSLCPSRDFKPDLIRRIHQMGHEIGYHYEVLNKAGGDKEGAIRLFEEELEGLRDICDVSTICMHGNPLSRYDDRDLWKVYDLKAFGIIGEAYLSLLGESKIEYISDTGRRWAGKFGTDGLIEILSGSHPLVLYINSHPERWAYGAGEWATQYLKDRAFNILKTLLTPALAAK